jgi:rSAM/selenodomain-associated transferase 2/rSAM/selenodomain-associated transferase 1
VKLRIVVPVLDEGTTLARRLQALAPLRARGAEVVVVDGGSTDATWAVAVAHADRVLLARRGRASQMNAGARGAGGDTLLFLHADTQLPDGADTRIADAIALGALWGRFDVRIDSPRAALRLVAAMMNLRSRLTGIATGDQAIFVRRDTFESVGGFAELPLMEDVELSRRLKKLGAPACLRERVLTSGRRWEQRGAARTILLMWRLRAAWFFGADAGELAQRYGYAPPPSAPPRTEVAVLARAPQAGQAKTRLIPALGPVGAARAQRRFILATLATAHAAAVGPIRLWCAPDALHRFFRALQRLRGVSGVPQPAGDLGGRMQHAFARHFAAQPQLPMLLVGTDCPVLAPAHLRQAARALQTHDVVLIPAQDGGYVLIGMRRHVTGLFDGIDWSTPQVLAQTRERLRAGGATWTELPALWDVDEPADWQRLLQLEHPNA